MADEDYNPEGSNQVCAWKVGGDSYRFLAKSIDEGFENRIVEHERPYREGAKCDDTKSKARRWTVELIYNANIELLPGQEGLEAADYEYPSAMQKLLGSFKIHETGDLQLPDREKVRAKAARYTRRETDDEKVTSRVTLVFIEDNEDAIDKAQTVTTARAGARQIVQQTTFDAESSGAWDSDLSSLNESVSQLEGFLAQPGEALADINKQTKQISRATGRIKRAFGAGPTGGQGLEHAPFEDPASHAVVTNLNRLEDTTARAASERNAGKPRAVPYTVTSEQSLFDVASELGQSAYELLQLNENLIEDPFRLLVGTVILVWEHAAAA